MPLKGISVSHRDIIGILQGLRVEGLGLGIRFGRCMLGPSEGGI